MSDRSTDQPGEAKDPEKIGWIPRLIFWGLIIGFPVLVFYLEWSGSENSRKRAKHSLALVCHCLIERPLLPEQSAADHIDGVLRRTRSCRKVIEVTDARIVAHYAQMSSNMRRDLIMLELLDQALAAGEPTEIARALDELIAYSGFREWQAAYLARRSPR